MEELTRKEELALNAKLQQKKNKVRKALKTKGVLKREGENKFDRYKYFSEAQYKMLFTDLFSENGLELKFDEESYEMYEGSEKQANGRMVRVKYSLIDTETGFSEDTIITGEGMDKGDKAGYKAYTGTLKYYLANTFMVATGDDPEVESPEAPMNVQEQRVPTEPKAPKTANGERKATPNQVKMLEKFYTGENLTKLLNANGIEKLEDISIKKASELIGKLTKKGEQTNG